MSFENLRAKWISSPERTAIENGIAEALTNVLRKAMPLIPQMIVDACVRAVMAKIDAMMVTPHVVAQNVKVTDHR